MESLKLRTKFENKLAKVIIKSSNASNTKHSSKYLILLLAGKFIFYFSVAAYLILSFYEPFEFVHIFDEAMNIIIIWLILVGVVTYILKNYSPFKKKAYQNSKKQHQYHSSSLELARVFCTMLSTALEHDARIKKKPYLEVYAFFFSGISTLLSWFKSEKPLPQSLKLSADLNQKQLEHRAAEKKKREPTKVKKETLYDAQGRSIVFQGYHHLAMKNILQLAHEQSESERKRK